MVLRDSSVIRVVILTWHKTSHRPCCNGEQAAFLCTWEGFRNLPPAGTMLMGPPLHSPWACHPSWPQADLPSAPVTSRPRPLTWSLGHIPTAKIGRQHPDRVVETSTRSSVPPPDITYTLALPSSDSGAPSALQLEAITYACQVIPGLPLGLRPAWG